MRSANYAESFRNLECELPHKQITVAAELYPATVREFIHLWDLP